MKTTAAYDEKRRFAGRLLDLGRSFARAAAVADGQAAVKARRAADVPAAGDGAFDGEDADKLLLVRAEALVSESGEALTWGFVARIVRPLPPSNLTGTAQAERLR